jgi:hypothetical protein
MHTLVFKRNLLILFLFLFISQINCFSQNTLEMAYYRFDDKKEIFNVENKLKILNSQTDIKNKVASLIKKIEIEYNLDIQIAYMEYSDITGKIYYGVQVNLKFRKKISEYFKALAHRPILIEAIDLNILQPLTEDWKIIYIIYKYNGQFITDMPTEVVNPLVVTRDMLDINLLIGKEYLYNN